MFSLCNMPKFPLGQYLAVDPILFIVTVFPAWNMFSVWLSEKFGVTAQHHILWSRFIHSFAGFPLNRFTPLWHFQDGVFLLVTIGSGTGGAGVNDREVALFVGREKTSMVGASVGEFVGAVLGEAVSMVNFEAPPPASPRSEATTMVSEMVTASDVSPVHTLISCM